MDTYMYYANVCEYISVLCWGFQIGGLAGPECHGRTGHWVQVSGRFGTMGVYPFENNHISLLTKKHFWTFEWTFLFGKVGYEYVSSLEGTHLEETSSDLWHNLLKFCKISAVQHGFLPFFPQFLDLPGLSIFKDLRRGCLATFAPKELPFFTVFDAFCWMVLLFPMPSCWFRWHTISMRSHH